MAVLASALLAACPAYATGNYSFKRIDNTFGLSSSNVKCVAEDSYGFIWLGTKNGLHRYDGLDMRRLNCFDHKKKQGNNNIAALYEDERKMMWVGTDRGVYLYNPKTDTFSFIDRKDRRNGKYPDNWVQTIDGDGKGNVWVLLPDLGVFHYHGQSVDYYSVTPIKDNLKEKFPSNICVDDNGDVWVTTASAGIYKFDKRARRFVRVVAADGQDMEGVMFTTVVEDTDGSLIFASTNGYLFRYNPVHNTFSKINFSAEGKIYMRCMQCFEDEIWIGTQHGLYILNKYDNTETVLHEDPLNKFSLSDDIIYCLYESRSGDVWIGTSFGGVNYTSRNKFYFKVFGLWSGLTGRVVNGLTQSADNRIWIGTEDRGLFSLNPSTNIISAISDITAAQKTVLLLTAFNGSVYAGFSRGGLLRVDGSGRVSTVLNIKEKDNSVYSYLKDSRGNEWVGLGYALYRRDAGQKDFRHVNETGYDWIFNLFEAHDGTVWIGTMGNGVWRYTPSTGKYKRYVSGETSRSGLRSNSISSFMEDSRGNVWVSTDRGGISRYNKKEDNFTSFGIEEGLPDDVAYNILEDNNGNLWFGTNKGLVKFNPDTRAVRVFTVKDGLPNNQFNYNSAIKANDGLFYFGSIGGIIAFNPDKEDNQTMQSSLYFTQLRILNEEVTVDTKNSPLKYARRRVKVALTTDDSNFIIKVTSDGDKISDSEKKLIFKRFYQIDKSNSGENGVGIGLPLSLSLASLLGGSLELADDGSDGNTFVAILPQNKEGIKHNNKLTVDTSDYLLEEETNQAKENTGGYTVLIVEDNDNMREFLAEQANMSFTIETARNGKEALEKLAGSHIDLIVSDVMMPEMDGFSLCKAVKADINLSHIPIVFITAKNDLESKIKGLQLGAEAYIEKPFSVKFFRQLIRSLLDNRRRERESFSKKPFFNMDNMHMTKADEEFMNKVIKIIEDNVGEDNFNVECMADILCMSHSSLLRKIKSVFNMSPVELIRLIKLKKAAELIQEGKHLIGDICYMVGISSPSYFSKLFFKQFGISPKDFEKQCREKQGNG